MCLTWCLEDLTDPHDSEQPDSTAAEPLEGPPGPRRCSHSSAGRISTETHTCCSPVHTSLWKNAPQSKAATWLSSCVRQTNARSLAGSDSQPPRPGTQSWAASLLGTCGWNIASQRLERVCAVMWGVWKVESRSHSEEQQQEAPFSELCLLRLSPLDCLLRCRHVAARRRQTHLVMLAYRRKPGFSLTSVWWPDSASSLQPSRPQMWWLWKS